MVDTHYKESDRLTGENGFVKVYKYIDFDGGMKMIKNGTLKFSKTEDFNDPYDLHEGLIDVQKSLEHFSRSIPPEYRFLWPYISLSDKVAYFEGVLKKQKESFRLSCFSEKKDDILMFSHYADSHKGLCVGFEIRINQIPEKRMIILPVKYVDDFEPVAYEYDNIDQNHVLLNYLSCKSTCWGYEKEVRLVGQGLKNSFIEFCEFANITEVYAGLAMGSEEKDELETLLKTVSKEIKMYSYKRSQNKFSLEL